ncbi:hypothetical protein [Polynucleobacter sp. MG-27-Goln-C1]|uniref:hypothetical protein n=1 Tax=Polynucleobacter sp. MG-27-Goln-C1 TaxID=1819726 RepID=UPI001C0DDA9A|nr:hypothetical protein [Polynucleobacter sp. MG-27-Goln-C1]MBU3613256.1 hypothetical protein [Polynucleobacter sp. MG-27-Goln-C1]
MSKTPKYSDNYMKTLLHASAGIFAAFFLFVFFSATLVAEFYYSPGDVVAVQQSILQAMWVYIPLILVAGGIGYFLGNERKESIVKVKKQRMLAIILVSIFLLLPSIYALASQADDYVRNTVFYGIEVFELIVTALLMILLALNARDGAKLTSDRPTVD